MEKNEIKENNKGTSKILLQSLYEQRAEKGFCDVKLIVDDSEIWCHSCVLASGSHYFKELLQTNCPEERHWCFRKPLDINISQEMKQVEICTMCVLKVVDYIYLKQLVVVKEHLEHFLVIVNFFKVMDLLPLCVNYSSNETELQERTKILSSSLDDTLCKKEPWSNKKGCKETSKLSLGAEELNKLQPQNRLIREKENTIKSFENSASSSIVGGIKPISAGDVSRPKSEISADHNYVIKNPVKNKSCEFICCNSFETSAPIQGEFKSDKRVMSCEFCTLSTVSVRKMLKHIENSKHIGNICAICYLKLPNIDLVRAHLKEHLNVKPYLCHICKKRNRIWEYHKLHYKVHCKNKQFMCEMCKKSFKHKQTLNAHMKSHGISLTENEDVVVRREKEVQMYSTSKESNIGNALNELVNSNKSKEKKFYCQICNEGFTQKKNLMRHSNLKHLTNDYMKCSGCSYQTKRSDLLKHHMNKYHKELVVEETSKPKSKLKKHNKQNKSPIVGVMIPVQLVSTTDSLAINGYVVERNEEATRQLQNDQGCLSSENKAPKLICSSEIDGTSLRSGQNEKANSITDDATPPFDCPSLLIRDNIMTLPLSKSKISSTDNKDCGTSNAEISSHVAKLKSNTDDGMIDPLAKCGNDNFEHIDTSSLSRIWLNEATGELLNENTFLNVHLVDSSRIETNFPTAGTSDRSLLDLKTPLQALILNEMSNGLPLLDFADDTDNFQSNPQTPQTSMVEVEETENLFSWNYLDTNFCSTWVLNEATGELNMVSFNMQPFKDSGSLQLDEKTGRASPVDDDDTALFLNEGTGDLSVIYFNPNKCDHEIPDLPSEQTSQEDQDNMSEHSNDDKDDLLNEEFLIASANFMAYEENETFLNELTGEFSTTSLGQYHTRKEENQPENMYLNEETGEISWNVLDKNIGRDFFTNSENLDFDESLNYDDFDLAEDINDFQFQSSFGLDTNISSDWHDEPCGTLLNECTGEFITKH